jgi:hypothetical protein
LRCPSLAPEAFDSLVVPDPKLHREEGDEKRATYTRKVAVSGVWGKPAVALGLQLQGQRSASGFNSLDVLIPCVDLGLLSSCLFVV